MKDELSNYMFHKEAKDILEKCIEISNLVEIKKEEKEKLEKETISYLRSKIEELIYYVEDNILLFEEESLNDINEEEFKENFYYVEQKLKESTKALILGKKKEDRFYDSTFEYFCECLYDRCKLEYARRCKEQGHYYRISDLLLMVSNTARKRNN